MAELYLQKVTEHIVELLQHAGQECCIFISFIPIPINHAYFVTTP